MFQTPLPIHIFPKEYPLKASNKITHIPLRINQFASLVQIKM